MSLTLKPRHTEKTFKLQDQGKYAFLVDPRHNKSEVKKEIERLYQVKVVALNAAKKKGKPVQRRTRKGVFQGKRKNYKQFIATLQDGHFIDVYQDQDNE
ncbi:MAG: 50S ribosomal protein L23 [Cytophagales bacterium]